MKPLEISLQYQGPKAVDRNREVNRFGEYRTGENQFGPMRRKRGQQPYGYNPRIQREIPAMLPGGERVVLKGWLAKAIWDPTFSGSQLIAAPEFGLGSPFAAVAVGVITLVLSRDCAANTSYIVDIHADIVEGAPKLYRILNLHEIIDLDDE